MCLLSSFVYFNCHYISIFATGSKLIRAFSCGQFFRCVCQERISIRGYVRPSVRPFLCPSVCTLRYLKSRSFRLFSAAAMLRIKLNTIWDASRPFYLSVRLSIYHFIHLTRLAPKSMHAETRSGRIVTRLGLFIHISAPLNKIMSAR